MDEGGGEKRKELKGERKMKEKVLKQDSNLLPLQLTRDM